MVLGALSISGAAILAKKLVKWISNDTQEILTQEKLQKAVRLI